MRLKWIYRLSFGYWAVVLNQVVAIFFSMSPNDFEISFRRKKPTKFSLELRCFAD
jgi:hypothetical protein